MKKQILFLSSILISTHVFSETLLVNPNKDNTLYESATGVLSNGAGDFTFIGKTGNNDGINLRRALTRFDVSAIPVGSVVNSVVVSYTVSKVPPGAAPASADLHLLLTDWGERASNAPGNEGSGATAQIGDATWLHAFANTGLWSTVGGDFSPTSSASTNYGTSVGEVVTFNSSIDLIADVQLWVDTPASNFGWIVIGDEATIKNSRRFNTRENASANPELTVDYTPPSDDVFNNGFENP